MPGGILASSWRSISLRIIFLSVKLYFVFIVILIQNLGIGGFTLLYVYPAVTTVLLALVVTWNLIWIVGLFHLSLRVHLFFHAVELGMLSFAVLNSSLMPATAVALLFSIMLFAFKLGDALSSPSRSATFCEQFSLFHPDLEYEKPRWEHVLRRVGGSSQLRVYGSKTLVALALLSMIGIALSGIASGVWFNMVILVVLLVHHLLSFFVTPVLHYPIDLLLCAVEASPPLLIVFTDFNIWGFGLVPCLILVHWVIFTTRIWNFIVKPPISRWQRFDLVNSKRSMDHTPRITLLLGRKAWNTLSLKGEHRAVKYTRAVLAIFAMGALFIFAILLIQRAIDTSSHERAFNHFTELYDHSQNLQVPRIYLHPPFAGDPFILSDATPKNVNITQICRNLIDGSHGETYTPKCEIDLDPIYQGSFLCKLDHSGSQRSEDYWLRVSCETRVEFDFGIFDSGEVSIAEQFRAVAIQVVGVNTTNSEITLLPSTTLRKHDNYVGDADVVIWETFTSTSGLNAFGYGGSFKRNNVAEVPQLRVDEFYSKGNISSLRLFTSIPASGQPDLILRVVREYNDHSILNIFADLGGIWTFVNGVFALIFGGSILYFLFGIKPLSRFGIVHFICRERLRRGTREYYPRFFEEGGQPGAPEAGVIAFIREHLLGVIADEQPTQSQTPPNPSMLRSHETADDGRHPKFGSDNSLSFEFEGIAGNDGMERIPLEPLRHNP
ncbi:hypothetical protein DL96DRAFT_1821118 [Flagelloscypha sp. PMI_526]|nr:hypothetical protein DL96DRAFT_1821118 [Flagelloscypha sp. PMI_526]